MVRAMRTHYFEYDTFVFAGTLQLGKHTKIRIGKYTK